MRRIVREAAQDDAAEGSRLAGDPGRPDVVRAVRRRHHPGPGDRARRGARRLGGDRGGAGRRRRGGEPDAAPAGRAHAGPAGRPVRRAGAGQVVGFGLSQRRAARVHRGVRPRLRDRPPGRAGAASRTRGELLGAGRGRGDPRRACGPTGSATACAASRTPRVLERVVRRAGWRSRSARRRNVALGVYAEAADVPLRRLLDAGAPVALGADDPLLFGSRLAAQYETRADGPGASPTTSSRPWPAGRSRQSRAPESLREDHCSRTSTPGSRHPPGPDPPQRPSRVHASTGRARQSEAPTRTGSLTRVTPKASRTPSRTSRARASDVGGRGAAPVGQGQGVLGRQRGRPGHAVALAEAGLLDQPRGAGLDVAVRRRRTAAAPAHPRPAARQPGPRAPRTARRDRIGLVKNEPQLHVSWSSASSTMPRLPPLGQHRLAGVGRAAPASPTSTPSARARSA